MIMVSGDRHHAEELRQEVTAVLAPLGLRLDTGEDRRDPHRRGVRLPGPPHPPPAETRAQKVLRLHHTVQEGHPVDQGQGKGQDDRQPATWTSTSCSSA